MNYLTFRTADELYGIDTAPVVEIIGKQNVTRVPTAPPFVAGVVNLRGRAIAVIDLAAKFGAEKTELGATTCIVIVSLPIAGEPTTLGLLVDSVEDMLDFAHESLLPPPSFGMRLDIAFLHGLAPVDDSFATILDLPKVLTSDELAVAGSAAGGAA